MGSIRNIWSLIKFELFPFYCLFFLALLLVIKKDFRCYIRTFYSSCNYTYIEDPSGYSLISCLVLMAVKVKFSEYSLAISYSIDSVNLQFVSKPCSSLIYDKPDTMEYISECL